MRDPDLPLSHAHAHSPRVYAKADADALIARLGRLSGPDLIAATIQEFPGRIALVSSFGTEAAVLLSLVAEVDPSLPVVFVDTGKLFGETMRYRDTLIKRLGLTGVRTVGPAPADLAAQDPEMMLWQSDPDACCHIRKTVPLERALTDYDAWITGRKRFQASTRAALPLFEVQNGRMKLNPLATWSKEDLEAAFVARDLPRHPLEADGYLSIGCFTCTARVAPGADARSGRWAGLSKTECNIHSFDFTI